MDVEFRSGMRHWDKRAATTGYEPRLLDISDIPFIAGDTQEVTLTVSNADGLLTTISQSESTYGCKVTIRRYVPAVALAEVVWVGYLEELTEVTSSTATLTAYAGAAGIHSQVPKRQITPMCPSEFGNTSNWVSVRDFDGSECPYQRTSTIGFVGSLVGAILAGDTSIIVDLNATQSGAGMRYKVSDELTLGTEKLLVTSASALGVGGTYAQTLGVTRGWRSTTPAAHANADAVLFAKCQKTTDACKCRGMYGNNPADTFNPGTGAEKRNYFAGFPVVSGSDLIKPRGNPVPWRVNFGSVPTSFDKPIPLIYGCVRLTQSVPLLINPENDYLTTEWMIGEGPLATNPNDDSQTTPLNAYQFDPNPPKGYEDERYFRVNGQLRHDLSIKASLGYGIQTSNGCQDQIEPGDAFFHGSVQDYSTFRLGMWGTAWGVLRISTKNNPSIDPKSVDVQATIGIRFGRVVRVYSDAVTFTKKPTTDPAFVLSDVMASRRAGAGLPYAQLNIQSFVDLSANNNALVTDTVNGGLVPRYTFNGILDTQKSEDEWVALLAMQQSATRPFTDAAGLWKVKALKTEDLSSVPVFTDKDAASRNVLWENDETTVKKFRRRRRNTIPNRIRANYVSLGRARDYQVNHSGHYSSGTTTIAIDSGSGLFHAGELYAFQGVQTLNGGQFIAQIVSSVGGSSATQITFTPAIPVGQALNDNARISNVLDFAKVQVVIDDEASQTLASGARSVLEKSVDFVGCSSLDEAARRATLLLRIGEFGEGGLANNQGLRWKCFAKTASDLEIADVVAMESAKLDPVLERYWRITDINDRSVTLPSGALIFIREIEAMIHDNAFYDDTAYTISSVIPIDPVSALNGEPPAVTGFSASDAGIVDQNGTLMTELTFNYTEPVPPESYRALVILRSLDDGAGNPTGDWRLVAEFTESPGKIQYPVSGKVEWFAAVSRPLTGHLPDVDTLAADGSFKYPRVSVLVDGMADTPLGTPTGLTAFGEDNQIQLRWAPYSGIDSKLVKRFNIYRNTVNNSATATLIDHSDTTWYIDPDQTIRDNPTTVFYYWIRGVSKLENTTISGTPQSGLSPFSAVASDNPGTDAAVPNKPVINVLRDVTNLDGNFTFVIGVDQPRLGAPNGDGEVAPTNWDTVESLRIQIAQVSDFSTTVFDQTFGFTKPPYVTEYEVRPSALGTYYFRTEVSNVFGASAWSATFTRDTNYASDASIMADPTNLVIATRDVSNNLGGTEFEVAFDLSLVNSVSYYAAEYIVNDVNTLPDPDYESIGTTGNDYSAYAPTGTVGTGNVTVGSNILTDTSKTFPTGSTLVGRRILIFSEKRPTGATWAMAGMVEIRTIQSATAHQLTLDGAVRLSGTNIQYAVLTNGGLYTQEKCKGGGVLPDYSQNGTLVGPKSKRRTIRIPSSLLNSYIWVDTINLWGNGIIAGPVAVTISGIVFADIIGGVAIGDITGDGVAPNAPTGLAAAAAFRSVILTWTNATNDDIVSTEIWHATTNNRASATLLATVPFPQAIFVHDNLTSGTSHFYWIRHVDIDGNDSAYHPSGATSGVSATTLTATLLSGEIAAATIVAANIAAGTITADRINLSDLFAQNITASGTITGMTLQTATSNARIVQDSANGLRAFDSSGNLHMQIPLDATQATRLTFLRPLGASNTSGVILQNGDGTANMVMRKGFTVTTFGTKHFSVDDASGVSSIDLFADFQGYKVNGTQVIDASGNHTGNGASLTSLSASNVSSGTLADARLSGNVMLANGSNSLSGTVNCASGGGQIFLHHYGSKAAWKAAVPAGAHATYVDGGTINYGYFDGSTYFGVALSVV